MNVPYLFEGAYANCYADRQNCMDERHVYLLHDLLLAGNFKKALEIGCYHGASTTAFLEACHANPELSVYLCDFVIGCEILDVINHRYDEKRVHVIQALSIEAMKVHRGFDFVLVDSSHDMVTVAGEMQYLFHDKPRCIVAHDSSATDHGYELCEGAKVLKYALKIHPEYRCIEDNAVREGEATHRGLFLATNDMKFYGRAVELFQKWSAWQPQGELVA